MNFFSVFNQSNLDLLMKSIMVNSYFSRLDFGEVKCFKLIWQSRELKKNQFSVLVDILVSETIGMKYRMLITLSFVNVYALCHGSGY